MMGVKKDFPLYPCIFVGWDNTPRRGKNGIMIINSDPETFELGLLDIVRSVLDKPHDERLIFINAWNEWAEGNHLEPDLRYGVEYLEAVKRIISVEGSSNQEGKASSLTLHLGLEAE